MDHQLEGFDFAEEHHYSINGFSMGYGKTLIGIMLTIKHSERTLIVCPAFLKRNWEKEFVKFCKKKLKIKVLFSKDLKNFKPNDEDVLIVNYEIIGKCRHLFSWADLVLADESHYLSNPSAKRTMAFAEFVEVERPERMLLMSGSPIRGKVPQWFAPIYLTSLNPKKTSGIDIRKTHVNSFWSFQKHFCSETMMRLGNRTITKFEGLKNVEGLKKLLKNKYIRTVPSFKLKLPPLIPEIVTVDYSIMDEDLEEAWKAYREGTKIGEHVSSAKKSSALNKTPFTFNFVKNIIDQGCGPVVIYSDHIDPVINLTKMFNDKKIKARHICGSVPTEERNRIVTDFQDNKLDVLTATIGAASSGINLTTGTKLVFNDISWINTENDQAKKRIHRIGQKLQCNVYYIAGSRIDKLIVKTTTEKDEIQKQTVEI